jgi:lysosomal alpha-mannosidase
VPSEAPGVPAIPLKSCLLLNISQCDISEHSSQFIVTVYNPLSHPVSRNVRVPVSGASYTIQDPAGKQVKTQLVPIPQPVIEVPGRVSPATMELVFNAKDLPPLGFRSYYISRSNHINHSSQHKMYHGKDVTLGNSVSQTAAKFFFLSVNKIFTICEEKLSTQRIPKSISSILKY